MSSFSVLKTLEKAIQTVDDLVPEELGKLDNFFERESVQSQYDKIKKWEALRSKAEISSHPKKVDFIKVINLIQFVRLSILDLTSISHQFIKKGVSEIEKRFYYRICAMIIYEIIEDIPDMLGKQIKSNIENLTNNDKEIIQDLRDISKEIGTLKDEELIKFIKSVRNISMAHKDHDSKKLFETIESVTEKEVLILTTYIFAWNNQFERFIEKLMGKFQQ